MIRSSSESTISTLRPNVGAGDLDGLVPEVVLRGRNLTKAVVSRYRVNGRAIAVKDYAPRPFLARHTFGRLFIGRECRAYERAGSIAGIAEFLGRLGPYTLATEWIDGTPLAELPRGGVDPFVFDRLDEVIVRLHERGVAIADLHHRDVLVGDAGDVRVVDFAAAYVLPMRPGPIARRLFDNARAIDRLAAARMRARFTGDPENRALASQSPSAVRLWGVGRRLKRVWDAIRGKRR